jgi:O-acetyl-ADP-ribose deacetylase (regulator of RNase III)
MIRVHVGNLLSVEQGIIVHGCNAQGVMGSGVAAAIRSKYPGAYTSYKLQEETIGLNLGDVAWYGHLDADVSVMVANAITQEYFGGNERHADYYAIRMAFRKINIMSAFITGGALEVNFPLIGCGLANGKWEIVSRIIDETIPDSIGKNLWCLTEKEAYDAFNAAPDIQILQLGD